MRWFLVSLGFLIISWIFFVASFGFAAPAQAETWSCSYLTVDKEPATMVFSRVDGKRFKSPKDINQLVYKWKVVAETKIAIHLYLEWPKTPLMEMAALFKATDYGSEKSRFSLGVHFPHGTNKLHRSGSCKVH
jgi:hypothetical protein